MKETTGERGGHKNMHTCCAGGFSENSHVTGVAAERSDIVANPLESVNLVPESVIARYTVGILGIQLRVSKEPENTKSIIYRHNHDFLTSCEMLPDIGVVRPRALDQAAPMDPDHNGQCIGYGSCGRPDIEIQTIFIHGAACQVSQYRIRVLGTGVA